METREFCSVCEQVRDVKYMRVIKLRGSTKFRRVCIWCMKRFRKEQMKKSDK